MPRTPKPQRTDLNTKVPVVAAPGQPYGQAGAQLAAQKTVPMAPGPPPAAPAPPPQQPQGPPTPMPGQMGSLFDPTQRPNEPVTAGAASGPGPGPEVLQQPKGLSDAPLSSMLQIMARASGSSDIALLAQHAENLGQ